jgi:hypothetical protein
MGHIYLFTIYLSTIDIIFTYFIMKQVSLYKTLTNSGGGLLKSEPMLHLKKVAYRLFLEKSDKRKGLRH